VVLPFTSASIVYLPDFRVRCDFLPSPTTASGLYRTKPAAIWFHCNIYGGVGHENMDGTVHVVA
jgi:heme/copper-type cytochrome/quinol oxidase subunit 2